ncbi:MAG: hypothetical protein FNP40_15435 [Dehalobacter sp. 4CP]|uniref:pyridoxamine 5'-phosphate oxidase family protein n=1 Tax=Dehalobacter sp. CP TaxID=2594474 RepID=UPI0013C6174D|nr:pyridoxamine 5'-phosphate oxidase family protein [Dehalobacter sp.]NBJ16916.1 hypothetical protein [Dehalobacter sp. 4CP]
MDFKDCMQFITESQATCTLCTIEGDQPRGRGMVPLWVKDDGIYFTTAASKDLYKQLRANSKVELCFVTLQPIKHLRIMGDVEFVEDSALREKALEERPFLKALGFDTPNNPNFILFRVVNGEAHFWTWGDNLKEADIPRIKF